MIYKGKKLQQIVFPLGGIGSGSIGLAGNGSFRDFEIFNKPNKGSVNGYTFFSVRAELPDGRCVARVLQGDHERDLSGEFSRGRFTGYGFGPNMGTMCGFPHFRELTFEGTFPIARLRFRDPDFPGTVVLTAFNPMIPLDSDNSGIPAAFFDIAIENGPEDVTYTVVFSVTNPFGETVNTPIAHPSRTAVRLGTAACSPEERDYGEMAVAVDVPEGICQSNWYRGTWQDHIATFWQEFSRETLKERLYDTPGKGDVCTVGRRLTLSAGETGSTRFVLAWYVPNCYNHYCPCLDENGRDRLWKNYYATLFDSAVQVAFHCLEHYQTLWEKTELFCTCLHTSSADSAVLDAVSSTMSVLKTATVLRLEDGSFYGFEGVHEREGCCPGTCTHVWSYAYALCFLFPELERSILDNGFRYYVNESGGMRFRMVLPLDREPSFLRPCLDGQMATVIKAYRQWKLGEGDDWLRAVWPTLKKLVAYAWHPDNYDKWDENRDGILEGRQHHTLDMEMFGPSSWLQGMYSAALQAAGEIAGYLGEEETAREYLALSENGRKYIREALFNGRYFFHKLDLSDKSYTEKFDCPEYWNEERRQLKYQIGQGCEIDQMLAQWHADLCGLGDIFDPAQVQIALKHLFANNYIPNLRNFTNPWRVFALNDEGAAIMCTYPEGSQKPVIPISYCEEAMTGFEYALAGLLISRGFRQEGVQIVRSVRDRYDGEKRNPYNEIECGSNYARPMSSFALLPILSGLEFDLPHGYVGFSPKQTGDFCCFFSLGTGWGRLEKHSGYAAIRLYGGCLQLSSALPGGLPAVSAVMTDGKPVPFRQEGKKVFFDPVCIRKELRFLP